jgi:hypothetical protein
MPLLLVRNIVIVIEAHERQSFCLDHFIAVLIVFY